ncbi:2-polyprenyl-6-methoxyphenol hydroxylase [Microbacterium azadirachtae]|uniref:2-polyprenyl-6-methoxyphenol hydroxylase n=1 Tax=Microbacterium azadirachtae TaxID=582680 RepID=A0A1I6G901_9MICO|nr:NAD(P)/FAD-dependent oxidoreductase [Microbacterium azadirachtae]SFR38664.1 2-polyprenyl-6-methoxyphenol hydroxylase [Microbacterium azadirachtae]
MRTLIIGGGIAGSTLAYALHRYGHDAVVAEARPGHRDTGGAFLYLAPNGINALAAIGLGDLPEAAGGFVASGMDFHNARGRRIADLQGEGDLEEYGAHGRVLRRARLHAELAERAQAAGARYEFDARLVELHRTADGVEAVFADGRSITADVVIGADGIWSTVRRLTWPAAPKPSYTGIVDCGSWTEVDLPDTTRQQMYFGHRAFFGYTVKNNVAYWFTNVPRRDEPARGELDDLDQAAWMGSIRRLHEKDPAPVRAILQEARHSLGAWPLYDMPALTTWHTNRVCLIGDAAHAVSPSTGQGASLAIEDAAVLAHWMQQDTSPAAMFAEFQADRKDRAEKIVRFGRQIGARKASSPIGSVFRDLTLSMFLRMGGKATEEQYGYQYGYRVPDQPAPPAGNPGTSNA